MNLIKYSDEQIQEIMSWITREETLKLWGQPYTDKNYLVSEKHGDGKQLVWLTTMNSRPFSYYIRVDSSLDLDKEHYEILPKNSDCFFDEMLMRMIEEEVDNIDRYEENDDGLYTCEQDEDEGIEPFEYEFPMFSLGAGHSYGVVDIKLHMADNKNFKQYE